MSGGWWHCGTSTMGRTSNRSAVAAAAYRMGVSLFDETHDKTHDYSRRGGVLESFTIAPEDAPAWVSDPARLWNEAEKAEKTRVNARFARETLLALPSFLSPQERHSIARELAQAISARYGVAVSVGMHAPGKNGDQRNYHAHLMFTTREIDAAGFGKKTRVLDDLKSGPVEFKKIQEIAAGITNRHLRAANSDMRVDHRSFKERDIDQEPTTHLGPTASEMERRGEASDRGDINREAERRNRQKDALKAEAAALGKEIVEDEIRLAQPATTPEDARERLQDDRQLYARGIRAAARLHKTLPADRATWSQRMFSGVARAAKALFDRFAQRARALKAERNPAPERRKRQQPTAHDQRWQGQEHERQQAAKNRGHDL